ncbi:hypothetical protein [Mucilaginibacter sp. OK098]|uniref:hypothetical protein n=1 Tax=Mucilaginibacter sp. OK098 TaxID=1855297 RepID=UPI000921F958|nr:hypothetical protein [Mucilaginibacter sp. OK098]SHN25745.1 hypothetical protein SAMN05216524_107332 [Mucilaginibacter sp. OK098]
MRNIKFNYLYRDSANYKKYGAVIFANPDNIELSERETLIRSKLIDGQWFYADEWGLPELFGGTFDYRIDPTWHEFEGVEYSNELAIQFIAIEKFKALLEKSNGI